MRSALFVAVAGLALGWLASSQTSQAQVGPKTNEVEHHCVDQRRDQFDAAALTAFLNEKGKGGWELCHIVGTGDNRTCVFQRRK